MFGEMEKIELTEPSLAQSETWSEKERLTKERQVTGFYITGHPLQRFEIEYNSFAGFHIGNTEKIKDMQSVRACGVLTDLRKKIDRSGKLMAFFKIDDFSAWSVAALESPTPQPVRSLRLQSFGQRERRVF